MKLLKFVIFFCACLSLTEAKIDKALIRTLTLNGKSDVLVSFAGDNSDVLRSIQSKSFPNRFSKVRALNKDLQSLSHAMQSPVQQFLKLHNVKSETFWAGNQMVIKDANLWLLQGVDAFPQVSRIQKLPVVTLSPIKSSAGVKAGEKYGVAKIQADQVWSTFNSLGENVVVANIDTGVRGTHEALRDNFRADHGWYDPYNTSSPTPDDGHGHGTHTMGTIMGKDGIGVAPAAQWIACRGCGSSSCASEQLMRCGQWMLAPTNPDGTDPDETKIPDVVSNSWGSNVGGDDWYNATINAWKAAGILHAFAIGNSGPACRSGGSPGDQPSTFSVGSTDKNDRLSIFSSKGPAGTVTQYIKPDISAPGSNIYSAWNTGDSDYETISGTSMACPHVAGVMALILSARRSQANDNTLRMTQEEVQELIEKTADTKDLSVALPNYRCDGPFARNKFPNNQFGYGRVNALRAVNATINGLPPSSSPSRDDVRPVPIPVQVPISMKLFNFGI